MRTLMSVCTDVAYWVGAYVEDRVVRLLVPGRLKTTRFKLTPSELSDAIERGYQEAAPRVENIPRDANDG